MASSFANPYANNRGPQKNVQGPSNDWFRGSRAASNPAPKSSAPKTQGTPYQSYAQQGQAQSIPPPSQGTPYQAYAQPSAPATRPASQTVTGDPRGGYVTAPAGQRPPPFQMGAAQTPWGQSMDPFVERDAFVNQLNQQRMQNQIAFNSGGMTNPAAGMTPGLNYQQAMQQAGLGGGAPSMAADYGDSLIQRLNQAFGGQGDPFTFANPQPPAQQFAGIYAAGTDMTKLPFTDTMQPNPAYRGPSVPQVIPPSQSMLRPMSAEEWRAAGSPPPRKPTPPGYPGAPSYGQAQPIAPPSQGTPPRQPAASSPPANGSTRTDPGSGKTVTYKDGQWTWRPNPISGVQPYDTSRFGDGTPQGQQPMLPYLQPPSQPQYGTPPDRRGGWRTADWLDADQDGVDDRDQDGPGMPAYGRPGQAQPIAPPSQDAKPTWSIPREHAAEFIKYQQSRGPRDMMARPERDRLEYEQWAAATGRTAPVAPEYPGQARPIQPPSQGQQYGVGQKFKYDKDPTLGNAEFQKWLDARSPARDWRYDRAVNEKAYDQFLAEKDQRQMDPKSKQFWTDYLSSPRVKDWAMKGEGTAAENARQKMQQLENSGPRPLQSRR